MGAAAKVILLNGPGSVGKSSVARALQAVATRPLLHVEMDAFLDMLPARWADHEDTFRFRIDHLDGHPVTAVSAGPTGAALMRAMRQSVAGFAAEGFDVVVDDVWLDGEPADYAALLASCRVFRIGLTASLDVLETREAARGDRLAGLSRAQLPRVHAGIPYDLFLDTGAVSPEAAARSIAALAEL